MICKIVETSENYVNIVIEDDRGQAITRILAANVDMIDDQDKPIALTIVYDGKRAKLAEKSFQT